MIAPHAIPDVTPLKRRFARSSSSHHVPVGPLVAYVIGARPNFVKMAPVVEAMRKRGQTRQLIVHTGQHYDRRLSDDILDDLGFPPADIHMNVGSGTHGAQTGKILMDFEKILLEHEPALVVVAGDVNSTLACALAASKLSIPVAHLESGLRSQDWAMPEEINRVLTDRLSDVLLTHSPECEDNLIAEGIDPERIRYVGNTMIDSLRRLEAKAHRREVWRPLGVREREYVLATLHRPSNVDCPERLDAIVDAIVELGRRTPVVFPVHPRTRARLGPDAIDRLASGHVICIDPVGYLDFLSLQGSAGAIVTDSGGVQEEASALGVPCYTFRLNTERPVTITHGTNVLLGDDPALIATIRTTSHEPTPCAIPLWDGHAGARTADVLLEILDAAVGVAADDAVAAISA